MNGSLTSQLQAIATVLGGEAERRAARRALRKGVNPRDTLPEFGKAYANLWRERASRAAESEARWAERRAAGWVYG